MRRAPQRWLGLPPRRLHLPRLSRSRGIALLCGILAAAGTALIATPARRDAPAGSERQQRAAVAAMLYGQDDPDDVVAPGLHGLGGRLMPIRITMSGRCRFTVAAAQAMETIDLTKITAVRYGAMDDPAAVIARVVAGSGRDPPTLQLVILEGVDDAICGPQGCTGHRIFALRDPGRRAAAQAAAVAFRRTCPVLPRGGRCRADRYPQAGDAGALTGPDMSRLIAPSWSFGVLRGLKGNSVRLRAKPELPPQL